ncbi:MAG: hypothetical protein H6656_06905 [Ardenticatenaceae bacterium]|nr:hypothetical protein [Ardenticatenaceae bacterium]
MSIRPNLPGERAASLWLLPDEIVVAGLYGRSLWLTQEKKPHAYLVKSMPLC